MKTRTLKLPRRNPPRLLHPATQVDTDSVCYLAEYGFSYRCIARTLFHSEDRATLYRIGRILRNNDLRVTDYRNGKTEISRSIISPVLSLLKRDHAGRNKRKKKVG